MLVVDEQLDDATHSTRAVEPISRGATEDGEPKQTGSQRGSWREARVWGPGRRSAMATICIGNLARRVQDMILVMQRQLSRATASALPVECRPMDDALPLGGALVACRLGL